MTDNLKTRMAEAIAEKDIVKGCEHLRDKMTPRYEELAKEAISHSDSKYVKGLVEALKFLKRMNETNNMWDNYPEAVDAIDDALQNLPEDLR